MIYRLQQQLALHAIKHYTLRVHLSLECEVPTLVYGGFIHISFWHSIGVLEHRVARSGLLRALFIDPSRRMNTLMHEDGIGPGCINRNLTIVVKTWVRREGCAQISFKCLEQ